MLNFHFRGLPLGCNIHLSHWLGFCCFWCERTDLPNVTFSANSSCSHHAGLTGHCSPSTYGLLLANELLWGQWNLKGTPFALVSWCQGALLGMQKSGWVSTLMTCPFVPVATLVFTYSTAQGKLKSLQRFIRERTQNTEEFHIIFQLELETQRLIRTKCKCKWRRKAGGDVLTGNTHHDQLKRGSSSSVPRFQLTVSMWK